MQQSLIKNHLISNGNCFNKYKQNISYFEPHSLVNKIINGFSHISQVEVLANIWILHLLCHFANFLIIIPHPFIMKSMLQRLNNKNKNKSRKIIKANCLPMAHMKAKNIYNKGNLHMIKYKE